MGCVPPTHIERQLYEAGLRGDVQAHLRVLAGAELFIGQARQEVDRAGPDGLPAEDGWVTTASAYDYGRAVNLARWGLSARYCDPQQAEQTIVHAGALAKAAHSPWEGFSAGYTLGRVLRFDGEEYGHFYEGALAAHRLLTDDEGSPWRNIPWR